MATDDPRPDTFEDEAPLPEETGSNRTFLIILAALGGLGVLILIAILAFAFLWLPGQRNARATEIAARQATNAAVIATNDMIRAEQTRAAVAQQETANALATEVARPTDTPTPLPTDTPTATPLPTDTPTLAPTPEGAAGGGTPGTPETPATPGTPETGAGGGGATATPTRIGGVSPGTPSPTPLVGALTRTPATATATATRSALSNTGFLDDFGVPGMVALAAGLIGVVLILRYLRASLR